MKSIKAWVITRKGNSFEVALPAKRIVCDACNGEGTELRGGLKGLCISDEALEDPDFCRSYFGGDYDVPCSECKGLRVLDVVDDERLSVKMADRYWRAIQDARDSDAADAAERRYFERAGGER